MVKEYSEILKFSRQGSFEKASEWIHARTKKSKISLFRSATPNPGWLANIRDPLSGYTALHFAALEGHFEVAKLLAENDARLLTSVDKRRCIPLHLACWAGHHQIVELLIEHEPSGVDATNSAKESGLHLAAQSGHGKIISMLLQKHANARLRNGRLETPLDIAARTGKDNVCRLLVCHCPELTLQSAAECSRAENKTVSQHIVYPLHVAARHGHVECLRVFCESGFDVNFVTEEGTALHVATLAGQAEAVRMLLQFGTDVCIKDAQGKTALEKLREYESMDSLEMTQLIQSKDGWAECRRLIQEHSTKHSHDSNGSGKENDDDKEIIWRPLPENSLAINNENTTHHFNRFSTASSNGAIYYPPSLTVEHVVNNSFDDERVASTITLSTTNGNARDSSNTENHSNSSSVSPSIASTSSFIRPMPKFPVTSPNAKARHASAKRFGNPVLINGLEPKMTSDSPGNEPASNCTYQPPPNQDTWQRRMVPYDNVHIGSSPVNNHTYRNIQQPYDNAPLSAQRKWDHFCHQHTATPSNFKPGTVGVSDGKNFMRNNNQVIREDGTQTIPALRVNKPTRPTILKSIFTEPIKEDDEKKIAKPALPPKPLLKDSKSTDFDKKKPVRPNVAFASSTLDRSVSPNKSRQFNDKAPLALPEEISGSTCTSIVSMSPERVLNPIDERLRRSMTTNSEDRTIVSMHEEYMPSPFEQNKLGTMDKKTSSCDTPGTITSPQSIDTIESSCSLPQVSQLSSSSMTSTRPCSSDIMDKSESSNVNVSLRDKKARQQSSTEMQYDDIETAEKWRKIDEILMAMHRDSFLRDDSQVSVLVSNRKSQALTLQLVNPSVSPRYSNICYPSEPEDLLHSAEKEKYQNVSKNIDSEVVKWLNNQVGLPLARSVEIGEVLEKNGFDEVVFLKGSLTKAAMHDLGIDKSIQHQICMFLETQTCHIPCIDKFDYASDWLSALHLIDFLELFAVSDLTSTRKIQAARLTAMDLKLLGFELVGHLERLDKSLKTVDTMSSSTSTLPTSVKSAKTNTSHYTSDTEVASKQHDDSELAMLEQKKALLLYKNASYSAHYLGSSEISNVEGAEDCRRAMNTMKGRIRQINKVPQVLLQISVHGVNVVDIMTSHLTVKHEISRIQVVCQDELDLNCFAYIFQDGDKNFCHVYCVLTADMAKDIIVTLGHAFNLAYNQALGNTGQ